MEDVFVCLFAFVCLSCWLAGAFALSCLFFCVCLLLLFWVCFVWCSFDRELLVVCLVVVHFFYVELYLVLSLAIPF